LQSIHHFIADLVYLLVDRGVEAVDEAVLFSCNMFLNSPIISIIISLDDMAAIGGESKAKNEGSALIF